MACEHKHLKCVNCEFICADCGAMLPMQSASGEPEMLEPPTKSASGRRIGFDAEKKPHRTRKGAKSE